MRSTRRLCVRGKGGIARRCGLRGFGSWDSSSGWQGEDREEESVGKNGLVAEQTQLEAHAFTQMWLDWRSASHLQVALIMGGRYHLTVTTIESNKL